MSSPPVKRKLAAILAADAVGYSRMMAADEEGTMKILSAHRSVIDGIIQFHEGRIINTAGDSVIAEFASPTQAVRCAVEVQDALKTRNEALPEDRRLHFRIGVNLGDVMVKGEDLLGDGVNIAARLEGIAEPGEIYLSSSVYDQIAGKLDLGFADMGEQTLKNIDRPIRAYRVERAGMRGRRAPARKPRAATGAWAWALAAVIVAVGGAAWFVTQQARERQDEQVQSAASAEIARARADAEAARKTADAATASAQAAKRALEEQRVAETRARAQAELTAARAEAEATRRKAEAELASAAAARRAAEAEAARRKAEAVTKPAAVAAGPAAAAPAAAPGMIKWAGNFACGPIETSPPTAFSAAGTSAGATYEVRSGTPGQPGSLQLSGTRNADDSLRLAGSGISTLPGARGRTYSAALDGRFVGEHYQGRGTLGARDCSLNLRTEEAYLRRTQARAASSDLLGTLACAAFAEVPPAMLPAKVSVEGATYQLRRGRKGEPGSLRMKGLRRADGGMTLTGTGYAGLAKLQGKSFPARIEGKFTGERYEGRGRLGRRDCALIIARP